MNKFTDTYNVITMRLSSCLVTAVASLHAGSARKKIAIGVSTNYGISCFYVYHWNNNEHNNNLAGGYLDRLVNVIYKKRN